MGGNPPLIFTHSIISGMNLIFSVPVLRGSAQLHAEIREGAG